MLGETDLLSGFVRLKGDKLGFVSPAAQDVEPFRVLPESTASGVVRRNRQFGKEGRREFGCGGDGAGSEGSELEGKGSVVSERAEIRAL